jgi:hypothetical protein
MPAQPKITADNSRKLLVSQKILDIQHRDQTHCIPLLKCRGMAIKICKSLSSGDTLSKKEKKEVGGFESILALISSEELSDQDYENAHDSIRQLFGVSMIRVISKLYLPPSVQDISESTIPFVNEIRNDGDVNNDIPQKPTDSQELALSILAPTNINQSPPLQKLLDALLVEQNFGLAFHLASCMEHQDSNIHLQSSIPSWLLRFLILSREVINDFGYGGIADTLKKDISQFEFYPIGDIENRDWCVSMNLLQAAVILRPTLLAPNTKLASITRQAHFGGIELNNLLAFCQEVAQYDESLRPLNFDDLKDANQDAEWKIKMEELQESARHWLKHEAPMKTINYAPGTYVWKNWLLETVESGSLDNDKCGLVYSLLKPVIENSCSDLDELRQRMNHLSNNNAELERRIDYTDFKVLKRPKTGKPIRQIAFRNIRRHLNEALDFVLRWVRLQESKPNDQDSVFVKQKIDTLKTKLFELKDGVHFELNQLESEGSPSEMLVFSSQYFRLVIDDVLSLFNGDRKFSQPEQKPKYILCTDLLRISAIRLDDQWLPMSINGESAYGDNNVLKNVLQLIAAPQSDWIRAFDDHDRLGNHDMTKKILEILEVCSNFSTNFREIELKRNRCLEKWTDNLNRKISETRVSVEDIFTLDLLKSNERIEKIEKIEKIENDIATLTRFSDSIETLREIQDNLSSRKETVVQQTQEKLDRLGLGEDNSDYLAISSILQRGDIFTANGYIDEILENGSISKDDQYLPIQTFSDSLESIATYLGSPQDKFSKVIKKIEQSDGFAGIKFSGTTQAYRNRAIELLKTWSSVTLEKNIDEHKAKIILNALGFQSPLVTQIHRLDSQVDLIIDTTPLQDKDVHCPVAMYGSNAEGHYRIICVWDAPDEEDLCTNRIGNTGEARPILVFRFGEYLRPEDRNDAAQLCHKYHRTYIMIDDLLVTYLCGVRGARLLEMFKCTLPFTFIDPYTTAPGLVPPEIFYGRRDEINKIQRRNDSCFIYGGRQLGKTALLKHVERISHRPENGTIVLFIDLKADGIGDDKGADEIWALLGEKLHQVGVLPKLLPSNTRGQTLLKHVGDWLNLDSERSILLLLDEADHFLEADGAANKEGEFVRTSYIKGLMDSTNRRFKVVFAGLHNVQRTTSLSNHPLAHYGTPLCIGPLLKDQDLKEAKKLIKQPLAAVGYDIPDDLVTRILSQTNYYPSLIQLYCKELLEHVQKKNVSDFILRHKITSEQVDDAYRSQGLRTSIRERFRWTLQLDLRYEVIAYAIANIMVNSSATEISNVSVHEVLCEVKYWWSEGFKGTSTHEVGILLEEMVGLGVLRTCLIANEKRYSLRSLNTSSLMGTAGEIADELLKQRELPLKYDPVTFRPAFNGTLDRRSPLTAQQESDLRSRENAVTVILGCSAAGLNEIQDYLNSKLSKSSSDNSFAALVSLETKDQFASELDAKLKKRDKGSTMILLVATTCLWDVSWVTLALSKVNDKRLSTDKFLHVVFIASPQKTWSLIEGSRDLRCLIPEKARLLCLKSWHYAALKQWVEDCEFEAVDSGVREKIAEATGSWHELLNRFFRYSQEKNLRWETIFSQFNNLFTDVLNVREMADLFGLEQEITYREIVLHAFAYADRQNNGSVTETDLIEWIELMEEDFQGNQADIEQILRWAELLNLVEQKTPGYWVIDPIVSRILEVLRSL